MTNWCYYSSLSKLVRHLAWILKLKRNWIQLKRGTKKRGDFSQLSVSELQRNRNILVTLSQMESYPTEYKALSFNRQINKNSKLLSFVPHINEKKILCVRGRINAANLPKESKNQMIVSKPHYLSSLIIMETHQHNFYIGRERTLCLLRNIYWIPSCRGLIRKILNECLYCKRERIKTKTTYMSHLPKDRMLINEKPFTSTCIDFFGPILIKMSRGTRSNPVKAKRYGVMFTCMTVRATHLKLASDLSTDAFIMALR